MAIAQTITRIEVAQALADRAGDPLDYRKLEKVPKDTPNGDTIFWGGGLTIRIRLVREYDDGNHIYRADLYVDDLTNDLQPVHGRTGLKDLLTKRGAKALAKEFFKAYRIKLPPKVQSDDAKAAS